MEPLGLAVVGIGAALGAWLRWWLGIRLNGLFPTLPLGTLAANLLGGFLVGVAVAYLNRHPSLPPETRLLLVTGFMGGLTTFSTFSSEVVSLVERGEFMWAFGSLLLTGLGIALVTALARTPG